MSEVAGVAEESDGFPPCMIPPLGWVCTREPGHEGPCAAHPVGNEIVAQQIERLKACLHAANVAYVKVCRDTAGARHGK